MSEEKQSFESMMNRLEEILDKVENSTLTLDESLKLFEEAGQLKNKLMDNLKEAKEKLENSSK